MTKAGLRGMALLLVGSMALAACASDEKGGSASGGSGSGSSGGDLKVGIAYDTGGGGGKTFHHSPLPRGQAATKDKGGHLTEPPPKPPARNPARPATHPAGQG